MKKVLKILSLIMLIITILIISDTYAKYYSEAQATLSSNVGKWVVKLNNVDIYDEGGFSKTITVDALNNFSSTNTVENKISPGNTGYTDIIIDATEADVAIIFDVEADFSGIEDDIKLSLSAEIANTGTALTRTGENKYTGTLKISEIKDAQQDILRCKITWVNVDTEEQNDKDTEVGKIEGKNYTIPLTITVKQYLGETITPYTE